MSGVRMIAMLFIILDGNEIKEYLGALSSQAISSNSNRDEPSVLKVFISIPTYKWI
jgi:hypothetical protein